MQLEAIGEPIKYRLKTGEEFTLRPGVPMELPDRAATQLLKKAPSRVRRVESVPLAQPGVIITWDVGDGVQRGPAIVDFLHTDPDGTVWAFCSVADSWVAVNTKFVTRVEREAKADGKAA